MHNGMHDHLHQWILHLMKAHEQLNKYTSIWLSVPAYYDLIPKSMLCEKVSELNGKAMEEMSRYLIGVVTQIVQGRCPTRHRIFKRAIESTWALFEFYMYARYKSDDDATLSFMEDALHCFHSFKDFFWLGRAGKILKARANALGTKLVNQWKVDNETSVETGMPSEMLREMNSSLDYIRHGIDVPKKLDADVNFLKINFMSHWVEQIHQYRALQ